MVYDHTKCELCEEWYMIKEGHDFEECVHATHRLLVRSRDRYEALVLRHYRANRQAEERRGQVVELDKAANSGIFDEIYRDLPTTHEPPKEEVGTLFKSPTLGACTMDGRATYFVDMDFHGFICSRHCYERLVADYAKS